MPYIKKDLRVSPDYIVELVREGKEVEALSVLSDYVKSLPLEQIEGTINYIFSRLIKNADVCYVLVRVENFVISSINTIYLSPPSYFKFNRVIGLLKCMEIEFLTRKWKNRFILGDMLKLYTEALVVYEKLKRRENGDIV